MNRKGEKGGMTVQGGDGSVCLKGREGEEGAINLQKGGDA